MEQPHPRLVSVMRPGQRLVLRMNAATLVHPSGSFGALGCNGTGTAKPLRRRDERWTLRAPRQPGAYELAVFSRFAAVNSRGDTSAGFGVVVRRHGARRILPAKRFSVC